MLTSVFDVVVLLKFTNSKAFSSRAHQSLANPPSCFSLTPHAHSLKGILRPSLSLALSLTPDAESRIATLRPSWSPWRSPHPRVLVSFVGFLERPSCLNKLHCVWTNLVFQHAELTLKSLPLCSNKLHWFSCSIPLARKQSLVVFVLVITR